MSDREVLLLANELTELERLQDTVRTFGERNGFGNDEVFDLTLALEEVVANVITHGFTDEARHEIHVEMTLDAGELFARVEDDGTPFNPLERPDPDLLAPIAERPIGGLGIFLTKKLMDRLEYRREGGRNSLSLWKRMRGEAAGPLP